MIDEKELKVKIRVALFTLLNNPVCVAQRIEVELLKRHCFFSSVFLADTVRISDG